MGHEGTFTCVGADHTASVLVFEQPEVRPGSPAEFLLWQEL